MSGLVDDQLRALIRVPVSASRDGERTDLISRQWAVRVTMAWAVLGAAVGLCPMYSKDVIYTKSWAGSDFGSSTTLREDADARIRLLGWVVYHGHGPDGYITRVVAAWTFAVGGVFAGVGAAAAVATSRLLPRRLRRPGRCDPLLWLLATGAVTAGLAAVGVPWENQNGRGPWWYAWRELTGPGAPRLSGVMYYAREGLCFVALALPVGWAAQVVAASCGVRLCNSFNSDLTADYAEVPVAEADVQPGGT